MKIIAAAIMHNGITFTGTRHGHIIRDLVELGVLKERNGVKDKITDDQQGFIDSNGIFVGRPHARTIAIAAGQVKPDHGILYSEDLW